MRPGLVLLLALALTTTAGAAIPSGGLVVPGSRLGGIRLGATEAQVRKAWGSDFGRCSGCDDPTWYFTYTKFQPQGLGVAFRNHRVAALFTLWSPLGWRTPTGLKVGDAASRISQLYGGLRQVDCGSYSAFRIDKAGATTAIYIHDGKVWGFGLNRGGVPLCH